MTEVKDFEVLDTTVVQVRSVLNFMYALGYSLDEGCNSGRFITKNPAFKGNLTLSFDTAAKLHNLSDENWLVNQETGEALPTCVNISRGFTTIGVRLAQASKLVKQVKLSITKNGNLKPLDLMVVPLNKTVEGLIGL